MAASVRGRFRSESPSDATVRTPLVAIFHIYTTRSKIRVIRSLAPDTMFYGVVCFTPTDIWVVDTAGWTTCSFISPTRYDRLFRMDLPLWVTVIVDPALASKEENLRTLLSLNNARLGQLLYSPNCRPRYSPQGEALLRAYPPPPPMGCDQILIPPCPSRPRNHTFIIESIEAHRPPLPEPALRYFTMQTGTWFLAIKQVDWSTLPIRRPTMATLCTLAAQRIHPKLVPDFLKATVHEAKRACLLALIRHWRSPHPAVE